MKKEKKNHSVSRGILVIFAIVVFSFNLLVKVDVKAGDPSSEININNLLQQHNSRRTSIGVSSLKLNPKLNTSAQNKADALMQSNCWDHYCPNGKSPWAFFDEVGYNYIFAGENLAQGFYNINDVMKAWLNSDTHRKNIDKKEYKEVGFGISYGDFQGNNHNIVVVAHFGTQNEPVSNITLSITTPKLDDFYISDTLRLEGTATGINVISIFLNYSSVANVPVTDGKYAYDLTITSLGKNTIFAKGTNSDDVSVISNIIEVNKPEDTKEAKVLPVTVVGVEDSTESAGSQESPISFAAAPAEDVANPANLIPVLQPVSPQTKNFINLGFTIGLMLIFIIDYFALTKTSILKTMKSYTPYHIALIMILGIIIIFGSFSGQIGSGLYR